MMKYQCILLTLLFIQNRKYSRLCFKTTVLRPWKVWHFSSPVGDLPSMLQINVFRVFHKKRTPVIEPNLHRGRGGVGNRYDTGIITYHLSYVMRALCFPLHHPTWSLGSVSVTISVNHCLFTNIWVTPSLGVIYFLWAWNLHWFSKNYGVIHGQVKRTGREFSCEFGLNLS